MKTDSTLSPAENDQGVAGERSENSSLPPDQTILFFDGVCGMCNRFVDFILRHDTQGKILLSPLQGETARERLSTEDCIDLKSVVLWDEHGKTRFSTAVVHVLGHLGGVWKILSWMLWLIPLPIRHLGYRFVASQRYRVFGKKEVCRMPTQEERARFLP